jgi:hypothetical protein
MGVAAISLTAQWSTKNFVLRKAVLHAPECAGSHTAAAISMAFENMFETWKHEHTPSAIRSTDWRNKLINCVCSRRDTLCHGIETIETANTDRWVNLEKYSTRGCEQAIWFNSL